MTPQRPGRVESPKWNRQGSLGTESWVLHPCSSREVCYARLPAKTQVGLCPIDGPSSHRDWVRLPPYGANVGRHTCQRGRADGLDSRQSAGRCQPSGVVWMPAACTWDHGREESLRSWGTGAWWVGWSQSAGCVGNLERLPDNSVASTITQVRSFAVIPEPGHFWCRGTQAGWKQPEAQLSPLSTGICWMYKNVLTACWMLSRWIPLSGRRVSCYQLSPKTEPKHIKQGSPNSNP